MRKSIKDTLVFILTAVTLFAALPCRAKDRPVRMENRFLFVIDSSSAMRSRTNGIEQAVIALLKSDMHGQLRKGDTLGLWTYNDRLHDEFPRQVWSDENKPGIISDVERYLRHEHYEKRAHLDKALAAVGQVIEASERLTVIFVYDGSQPVRGTPFDDDINGLQKEKFREFRSAHLPMVMVLVARDGEVYDYTVNYPTEIKIPKTAVDLPPPQTNAPPTNVIAAVPAPPPKPHRRIEIVMRGTNTVTSAELVTNTASSKPGNIVMVGTPPPSAPSNTVVAATPPAPTPPPLATQPKRAAAPSPAPAPAASIAQQIALFVIAISLLTIAVVLVIFLIRRSRSHSQPSLISQSIDRGH